jgi:hypothetical protein
MVTCKRWPRHAPFSPEKSYSEKHAHSEAGALEALAAAEEEEEQGSLR